MIIVFQLIEADDPDLDSLLADLCKLEEETAAAADAAATGDTKPSTVTSNKELISSDEFASFMQGLQQSENIINDPISLAIYDIVKLKNQPNQQSLKSDKKSKNNHQKKDNSRVAPLQHGGYLTVGVHQPPSSIFTPSYVSVQ